MRKKRDNGAREKENTILYEIHKSAFKVDENLSRRSLFFLDLIDHIFLRVNISFASRSRSVPLTCQPACAVMS